MQLETIQRSLENGQRKQAVEQLKKYGVEKFFKDYPHFLGWYYQSDQTRFDYLAEMTRIYYLNR